MVRIGDSHANQIVTTERPAMKPRILIPLAVAAAIAITFATLHLHRTHSRNAHQAQYRAVLEAWSNEIAVGMNRTDAENVLHQKDIPFLRASVQGSRGLDDLITIGHETPPFFCSNDDVYVRVSFNTSAGSLPTAHPTDRVQQIDLFEMPRACL